MPSTQSIKFRYLTRTSPSVAALADVEDEAWRSLDQVAFPSRDLAGRRIAVAAGSRGIASFKEIVGATCRWLRSRGAIPFVFPSMGSHGGGTAEGQRQVLHAYGIVEEYVGAPVVSSMETVELAKTDRGLRVFVDRNAWESDGIVILNRVKPHTSFSGRIESGLLKMIAVGLGKREGAEEVHRAARRHGYEEAIREIASSVLGAGRILCGLAVVENEWHEVCQLHAIEPDEMARKEEAILEVARRLAPRLPLSGIQLLIVDEMGKNISGTGMDTKVIGRGAPAAGEASSIDIIYVRDLSAETEGNAIGIGFADLAHQRVHGKVDLDKTYVNARASLNSASVRLPMFMRSDRDALEFALRSLGSPAPEEQRLAWIRNTLELHCLLVSEPLAAAAAGIAGWQVSPVSVEAFFDEMGDLEFPDAALTGSRSSPYDV